MVQLNPVSFFGEKKKTKKQKQKQKKNTSTIWRKIFTEMSVQMVSALGLISQKATLHVQHTSFVHFFAALFWLLTWNLQKLPKYTFYGGNVVRVLINIFFSHCRWFSPCIGRRKHLSFSHPCYEIFIFVAQYPPVL